MVTPEVYPPEAAAAGCSVSCSEIDSAHSDDSSFTFDAKWYRLSATAAVGWEFDHFEWTQIKITPSSRQPQNYTNGINPYPQNGVSYELYESETKWKIFPEDLNPDKVEITYCRAVFKEDTTSYGDITVETSANPAAGGTTAPVTETHQYSGSASTTFTLVATPNNGWRFVNWKLNGAVVATTNTTTVTHTFTSYAQTFHYVAEFLQSSGLILHGSGGTILHGSGGSILHSG